MVSLKKAELCLSFTKLGRPKNWVCTSFFALEAVFICDRSMRKGTLTSLRHGGRSLQLGGIAYENYRQHG